MFRVFPLRYKGTDILLWGELAFHLQVYFRLSQRSVARTRLAGLAYAGGGTADALSTARAAAPRAPLVMSDDQGRLPRAGCNLEGEETTYVAGLRFMHRSFGQRSFAGGAAVHRRTPRICLRGHACRQ